VTVSAAKIDKDEVYEILVAEILAGGLDPDTPLSERALVERFGISRTPVRQVLWRLERDDLVTLHPNRGAFLKKLGVNDIVELFQLREVLEPLACGLAAVRRPDQELDALAEGLRHAPSDDAARLVALGEILHDSIVLWSGNSMLGRIYEQLRMRTRLMRNLLHDSLGSERDSRREHEEIVAALQARDAVASRNAMERHLVRSRHAILRNLFGEGAP